MKIKKLIYLNNLLHSFNIIKTTMSFLYHGYDMSETSKYTINCKDCPKKVKVFQASADSDPPPQTKNVGKYYYSCQQSNSNCNCKYFRWFEHKWPKVQDEYQNQISGVNTSSSPIENEMTELISQIETIDIHELSEQDKIEIKNLVGQLKTKINKSSINMSKKIKYNDILENLINL